MSEAVATAQRNVPRAREPPCKPLAFRHLTVAWNTSLVAQRRDNQL
jgi:hypothetical protein